MLSVEISSSSLWLNWAIWTGLAKLAITGRTSSASSCSCRFAELELAAFGESLPADCSLTYASF